MTAAGLLYGVDLGGTFVKAGAVTTDGRVVGRAKKPTGCEGGPERVVANIASALAEARAAANGTAPERVGIGVPGVLDREKGILVAAPNLQPIVGGCFRDDLEAAIGAKVLLENDANVAAVAEREFGGGGKDFLLFTLGTGVGGGLILDGRLWIGPGGMGGEFGHVVVEPEGIPCGCGSRGCVERYASATAIVAAAKQAIREGKGAAFDPGGDGDPKPAAVAEAARKGDPTARAIFDRAGRALGVAIVGVVNLLDLRSFVATGGFAGALDVLLPGVRAEIEVRIWGREADAVRIVRSALGGEAGILGAAALARAG